MHKTIGYKKKHTRYDEKNEIRRKSKKYLGQYHRLFIYLYIVGKYYIQTFLKKYLHIIHGRCIIMQVKHGKCIFIHLISGNTLHPD
jgi:hypothetical protein